MRAQVEVDVVRVFTDDRGAGGNALGLVESTALVRGREQAVAAALGFSETVFLDELVTRDDGRRAARIRIFTPAMELPFAGHPSVGTAWWLAARATPVDVLAVPAGDVGVRHDGDLTWITARGSWAPPFTWEQLATPAGVDALDPSGPREGEHYAYAWIDEAAGLLRSRMFAPGIVEDEATGAAAVGLCALLGRDLDVVQGRGSRLHARHLGDDLVELGGRTAADLPRTLPAP